MKLLVTGGAGFYFSEVHYRYCKISIIAKEKQNGVYQYIPNIKILKSQIK